MPTGETLPDDPPVMVDHVSKHYGQFTAVDDLSFSVRKGEIYGFLGQNGAGKTTTLRMIMDIVPPSSGGVKVLGSPKPRKVKRRIGYLPEERGLYRKMKARNTIAYFARLKGMNGSRAKAKADELLEQFGLGDGLGRMPRVDARAAEVEQLFHSDLTARFDDRAVDHHVVVEELGGAG